MTFQNSELSQARTELKSSSAGSVILLHYFYGNSSFRFFSRKRSSVFTLLYLVFWNDGLRRRRGVPKSKNRGRGSKIFSKIVKKFFKNDCPKKQNFRRFGGVNSVVGTPLRRRIWVGFRPFLGFGIRGTCAL
jgi:hypothetical protein